MVFEGELDFWEFGPSDVDYVDDAAFVQGDESLIFVDSLAVVVKCEFCDAGAKPLFDALSQLPT